MQQNLFLILSPIMDTKILIEYRTRAIHVFFANQHIKNVREGSSAIPQSS
jgi:hypothetical protein